MRMLRKLARKWIRLREKCARRVEGAIQELAKKIQQMEEELAAFSAGTGSAERITRKRKTMENEVEGNERGHWSTSFISLNGWVERDNKKWRR